MAKVRFSHLDDFVLKDDGRVGIGTSLPSSKVEVIGTVRAANIKSSSGITTIVSLDGYVNQEIKYGDNVTVDSGEGATLSGEVVVGAGLTLTVGTGVTSGQGSIERLKVSNTFTPPIGGINERPSAPQPGALFYNKDFRTIEYWDGNFWRQVDNTTRRGRGLYCGGTTTGSDQVKTIDYIEIATQGNAIDFGELSVAREGCGRGTISSAIRGISFAGWVGSASNVIDYNAIPSGGVSVDFGNAFQARGWAAGMSSSTRGLCAGGYIAPTVDTIDYIEIATTGTAKDFGNLPVVKESTVGMSSPTRGIVGTGMSPSFTRDVDYITIASKGDAIIFGDLGEVRGLAAAANTTRGLFTGGKGPETQNLNAIYKITIASTGSITDFGSIGIGARKPEGVSNSIRACFAGGNQEPAGRITRIESVNFSSDGISEFFGDLSEAREVGNSNSDSHGGLGGF